VNTTRAFVQPGKWGTEERLGDFIRTAAGIASTSARIEYISREFLDIQYRHPTLIGSPLVPEQLIVNLESVDCFTYLDYVEAIRLSHSFDDFIETLVQVRYKGGVIAYEKRRHFFTDWLDSGRVEDVTAQIGGLSTREIMKTLNVKSDGSDLLQGIPMVTRLLKVAPPRVDQAAMHVLHTGDYLGIYEETDGLDVTHVGLVVKDEVRMTILLRHASSAMGKVLDQDLYKYLESKCGIIILRPRT
jgi:hypothetical protein